MVLLSVLRRALDQLPLDIMRHMQGWSMWFTEGDTHAIARDPGISSDENEGLFWLEVNACTASIGITRGNRFRFGYSLHGAPGRDWLVPGTLMRVENISRGEVVWKRG